MKSATVAAVATFNIDEQIDVSGLDSGIQIVSYRFKDTRDLWGNPKTKFFAYYPNSQHGFAEHLSTTNNK